MRHVESPDGGVALLDAAEHAVTLNGVTPNGVYVNDPARGASWVSKKTFEAGYSSYLDAAVVLN